MSDAETHVVVGLISGTSADGIDAALVTLSKRDGVPFEFELHAFLTLPYPSTVRDQVLAAANARAPELAELNVVLGELFASATLDVVSKGGLDVTAVDYVGSHGQTVVHLPSRAGKLGATMQIGSAAVIAERTGCLVVSDFRSRDMVVGGEGAPLVPLVDHLLFARPDKSRVALNIGGIANLTWITNDVDALVAFDTGPGNALLDAIVRIATDGAESFDPEGWRGMRGKVDRPLLEELLRDPYFAVPPPKSLDRDRFGAPMARRLLQDHPSLSLDGLIATAAAFTAESIARSIDGLATAGGIDEVIVSGGGVHNQAIMSRLRASLAPITVVTSDALGVPSDAKEAIAFAILARQTVLARPGNVRSVTGATHDVVLGAVTPGSRG